MTLGEAGALLSRGESAPALVPAAPVQGGDTCGAGDRFAAAAAAATVLPLAPSLVVVDLATGALFVNAVWVYVMVAVLIWRPQGLFGRVRLR